MPELTSIYRAIEYIEAHLRDEITVTGMAEAAGYSLYHFIRTFNQLVFHTPYDYLIRRRLSAAAGELITSDRRVLDIALDYRFNNHETFSRAFKRLLGLQPSQWRERGFIPRHSLLPAFELPYLEHLHRPGFQHPQLVRRERRVLAGLMAPLPASRGDTARLWGSLEQAARQALPGAAGRSCYGVVVSTLNQGGEVFYLAAVEILAVELAPPVLVTQVLPAGEYACMAHPGPDETLQYTLDYLYHTWLPKAGRRPAYPLEVEFRGADAFAGQAVSRVEIPLSRLGS